MVLGLEKGRVWSSSSFWIPGLRFGALQGLSFQDVGNSCSLPGLFIWILLHGNFRYLRSRLSWNGGLLDIGRFYIGIGVEVFCGNIQFGVPA